MSETLATASAADLAFWNNKIKPTAKALKHFGLDKPKPRRKYKKRQPPLEKVTDKFYTHDIIVRGQMVRFTVVSLFKKHIKNYTGVSWRQVTSREQWRTYAMTRHCVMYILHTKTRSSLDEIGRAVGGRDHSTIKHGIQCVKASLFGAELPKGVRIPKDYRPLMRQLESLIQNEKGNM